MIELPHSEDSERAVIGGLILGPQWYWEVADVVEPDDFYSMAFREIFRAIEKLIEEKKPVHAVSIAEGMKVAKTYHYVNALKISTLTDDCVACAAVHHARTVRDFSKKRKIIFAARQAEQIAMDPSKCVDDCISEARSAVSLALDEKPDDRCLLLSETIQGAIRGITEGESLKGVVLTGLKTVDEKFGGIYPRILTVLAGRPGMGKSTFLVNLAMRVAFSGKHVYFITLEDDRFFIQARILANLCKIDNTRVTRGFLGPAEIEKVKAQELVVASLKITIDDGGPFTSDQVRRRCAAHCSANPCDLIIIDHLGHVSDQGRTEYEIATKAIKILSGIPKETGKPVLLAAQLNRGLENRSAKEPNLADLRGTGEIEQRARAVWFLHRPRVYDEKADPNELDFIVAKANHGRTGKQKLWVDLSTMRIQDETPLLPQSSGEENTERY